VKSHLRAGALSLDAVPRAGEAELVVRLRGTLDKVSVLEALVADCALEGGASGGGGGGGVGTSGGRGHHLSVGVCVCVRGGGGG
jgi:hypothetical protein